MKGHVVWVMCYVLCGVGYVLCGVGYGACPHVVWGMWHVVWDVGYGIWPYAMHAGMLTGHVFQGLRSHPSNSRGLHPGR